MASTQQILELASARSETTTSRTHEVTKLLRDEILRGQYRIGERLPSERDLALRFQVNRAIASAALQKLDQLGIIEIAPGGARATPIEHASLDVIGHLLDLDEVPGSRLVEQVLEAHRGLTELALRLGVPRASDAQIERALEITHSLMSADLEIADRQRLQREFSEIFVEASGNLVLKLIRRAVNVQFMERVPADERSNLPHPSALAPLARQLIESLEARDGDAAATAMSAGMRQVHERWITRLPADPRASMTRSENALEKRR